MSPRNRNIDQENSTTLSTSSETRYIQVGYHNDNLVSSCLRSSFSYVEKYSYNVNYINRCWINDLVRLLKEYEVEIRLRDNYLPQIQRENDTFIIENMLTNSSSLTTQKKLLVCRLYLQVVFLSNLANLKGEFLLSNRL